MVSAAVASSGDVVESVPVDHRILDAIASRDSNPDAALLVADEIDARVRTAVQALLERRVPAAVLVRSLIGYPVLPILRTGVAWLGVFDGERSVSRALARLGLTNDTTQTGSDPMAAFLNLTPSEPAHFRHIVTSDAAMLGLLGQVELLASTNQTILITGETGTGKDLLARAIHSASGRSGNFVAENIAGLSDELFSDALFGHTRGSYTGATADRDGLVVRAAGGTLFLDEIADLSLAGQTKLLRLLENREFHPLGSDARRVTDARFVVATQCSLEDLVADGRFRRDLYYRLRVHEVRLPSLCDRPDDIPLLTRRFVAQAAAVFQIAAPRIGERFLARLRAYSFPGNVRELRAMVFRAVAFCRGARQEQIEVDSVIPTRVAGGDRAPAGRPAGTVFPEQLPRIDEVVNLLVAEALDRADGNQSVAARMIGVCPSAVSKRLKADR